RGDRAVRQADGGESHRARLPDVPGPSLHDQPPPVLHLRAVRRPGRPRRAPRDATFRTVWQGRTVPDPRKPRAGALRTSARLSGHRAGPVDRIQDCRETVMSEPSPQEHIARLVTAYWASQAVFVAAKLGIADRLAGGPRPADELAQEVGAHPRSLYRLLR